jgi:hypothetical protein
MKCKVTVGTLFIAGQKYRRGDIVELANADGFGTQLEMIPEAPVAEKLKATRKPRAKKVAVE